MAVSVVIADSHQLFRQGIIALLASKPEINVIGEVGNGVDAVEVVKKLNPDIFITEITLPHLNGIDVVKNIHSFLPNIKIIGLSSQIQEHLILEMLKAGASAFLTKDCSFDELYTAIDDVSSGLTYLSPLITSNVLKQIINQSNGEFIVTGSVLSGREREVLQLIAEGYSSKAISSLLNISQNTVIRHRQHITDKLGINGVAEMTRYAIRECIIEP